MVDVFITVDTELWPFGNNLEQSNLQAAFNRDILGIVVGGECGLPYQLDVLTKYNLKAVFLVEALFAEAAGLDMLGQIVKLVHDGNQEVQLHLHSEWLDMMPSSILPGRTGHNMKDFTEEEQTALIAKGVDNLRSCGVDSLCAFRAGNYGANQDTLKALANNGIGIDTSYNLPYLTRECGLELSEPLVQPVSIGDTVEFPVSHFEDWPNHFRHAQLCACSAAEMKSALMSAWANSWRSFVIVSHSFELVGGRRSRSTKAYADKMVISRFEELCRFLASHRDKFRTSHFRDIIPADYASSQRYRRIRSKPQLTIGRSFEQFKRRMHGHYAVKV